MAFAMLSDSYVLFGLCSYTHTILRFCIGVLLYGHFLMNGMTQLIEDLQ
jgi:hypothetical protein